MPPGCGRCPRRRSRSPRQPGPPRPRRRCRPTNRPGCAPATTGCGCARMPGPLVNGHWPSSQVLVLPTMTAPAARSRRTTSASAVATRTSPSAPNRVGAPATSTSSLTAIGMPSNGSREAVPARFASAVGGGRVGEGLIGQHHSEGVEGGLARLDGCQRPADQFVGRGGAAGQLVQLVGQGGEPGGGMTAGSGGVSSHHVREYRRCGPVFRRVGSGRLTDAVCIGIERWCCASTSSAKPTAS